MSSLGYLRSHDCNFRSPLMKTLVWSVETLGLDYNSTGKCSERNMIDIPGCSEWTNFKRFRSVSLRNLRNQSNDCVLPIFFSTVEITTRDNLHTNVFSREIFRISLVVELGLNACLRGQYFVHLNWIRFATNPRWLDNSMGIERRSRYPKMRVQIPLEPTNFSLFDCSVRIIWKWFFVSLRMVLK
jgi:hypothetical protein